MLDIEDQVCSPELARKLKNIGVKQDSQCAWYFDVMGRPNLIKANLIDTEAENRCAAFSAAELGEFLPNIVTTKHDEPFNNYRLIIQRFITIQFDGRINNYVINYECDSFSEEQMPGKKLIKNIYNKNLANAMAEMLIKLYENKELKVKHER